MPILFSGARVWNAANWVARAFYGDANASLDDQSPLADQIRFCVNADFDTLDLENANRAELDELAKLVETVVELNERRKGENFAEPSLFPVYLQKLVELRQLVAQIITN